MKWSVKILHLSICLLISGYTPYALAEITDETHYYAITASNAEELNLELSKNNRNGFLGDTKWSINTRYRFKEAYGGCEVAESKVSLHVVLTMPKWVNKEQAPEELQKQWATWYMNLLKHESNHRFNGEQAYNNTKQSIYQFSRSHSCAQLSKDLASMVDRVRFKYSHEDKLYDQRTDHGASEGTRIDFKN